MRFKGESSGEDKMKGEFCDRRKKWEERNIQQSPLLYIVLQTQVLASRWSHGETCML